MKPLLILLPLLITPTLSFPLSFPLSSILFPKPGIELPKYEVLTTDGDVETRMYQPMIVASVKVAGQRSSAASTGFRELAAYIFGGNAAKKEIKMTAPVMEQKLDNAAVSGGKFTGGDQEEWKVSFMMPSRWNMTTLPQPDNQQIHLEQIPAQKFIAIRYSGISWNYNVMAHVKKLREYVTAHSVDVIDNVTPMLAFYDPPWRLPFMRRNEVLLQMPSSEV